MQYSQVHILYASQTGTALEAGFDLYRDCRKRGFPVSISPLETYDLDVPEPALLIIIASTTGDGAPPTHIEKLWRRIMSAEDSQKPMGEVEFTVFGLGDSSYSQFNIVARKLWVRFQQLGARPFYRKGLGDDQHDFEYEGEFDPWVAGLWPELESRLIKAAETDFSPLVWETTPAVEDQEGILEGNRGRYRGKIVGKKRMTEGLSEVYLLHIETEAGFCIGDVCALYPENDPGEVDRVLNSLKLARNQVVSIHIGTNSGVRDCIGTGGSAIPGTVSIGDLAGKWLDLHKSPTRHSLSILQPHAHDPTQSSKLSLMTSKTTDGRSEFHRYITKEKRSFPEVLWDFSSVQSLSLPELLECTGFLSPRSYSISCLPGSGKIELIISMKKTETPFGRTVVGLCSRYVREIREGDWVGFDILTKDALFPPPDSHLLMVACGTGIAAFWGMIQDRVRRGIGGNVLFYGCKNEDCWLYREEMLKMEETGL